MSTDVDIANLALSHVGHAPDKITSLAGTDTTSKLLNLHYPIARDIALKIHNWNFATKKAALVPNTTPQVFEFQQAYDLPSDHLRVVRTNLDAQGFISKWRVEGSLLLSNEVPAAAFAITGATQANPVVISTSTLVPDGASVVFASVGGMTDLNGNVYVVDNPTGTSFELQATDGTGFGAYTSGGTAQILPLAVEYISKVTDTTLFTEDFVDLVSYILASRIALRLTDNANILAEVRRAANDLMSEYHFYDSMEGTPRQPSADSFTQARL